MKGYLWKEKRLVDIDREVLFPFRKTGARIEFVSSSNKPPIHVMFVDNYGNFTMLLHDTAIYIIRSLRMVKDGAVLKKVPKRIFLRASERELWEEIALAPPETLETNPRLGAFMSAVENSTLDHFNFEYITEYQQRLRVCLSIPSRPCIL